MQKTVNISSVVNDLANLIHVKHGKNWMESYQVATMFIGNELTEKIHDMVFDYLRKNNLVKNNFQVSVNSLINRENNFIYDVKLVNVKMNDKQKNILEYEITNKIKFIEYNKEFIEELKQRIV